jgi:hypothetical protein
MLHSAFSLLSQFSSTDMSASINCPVVDLNLYNLSSLTLIWTGSPNGSFSLQGSNDIQSLGSSVVNFDIIPNSQIIVNSAGKQTWNFTLPIGFKWFRPVWTFSTGTGIITACNCTLRY